MKTGQESKFNVFLVVVSVSLLDKFIKFPGWVKFHSPCPIAHSPDFWDTQNNREDGPTIVNVSIYVRVLFYIEMQFCTVIGELCFQTLYIYQTYFFCIKHYMVALGCEKTLGNRLSFKLR